MPEMEIKILKHLRAKAASKKPGQLCGLSILVLRYLPVWSWTSDTIFGDSAFPLSWPRVPFSWLCRSPKINSLLKERQHWWFFLKERQCQGSAFRPSMMDGSFPTFCSHPLSYIPTRIHPLYSWFHHQLWLSICLQPTICSSQRMQLYLKGHPVFSIKGRTNVFTAFFSQTPSSVFLPDTFLCLLAKPTVRPPHDTGMQLYISKLENIRILSKRKNFHFLPKKWISITSAKEFWLYNTKIQMAAEIQLCENFPGSADLWKTPVDMLDYISNVTLSMAIWFWWKSKF